MKQDALLLAWKKEGVDREETGTQLRSWRGRYGEASPGSLQVLQGASQERVQSCWHHGSSQWNQGELLAFGNEEDKSALFQAMKFV